jgi:hypothetical protein
MKYFFPLFGIILLMAFCKTNPDSNRNYAGETKVHKLHLNPPIGSKYHYDIINETDFKVEVDNKKTSNENKTSIGVNYEINKDSAGNFVLNTNYDKIHIYSKNGDVESEVDADNSSFSLNPVEKMLGPLKAANITATVSPTGELKSSSGYQQIAGKILDEFKQTDEATRAAIEKQWNKLVEEKIVKNNMDEFFKIFPDSAVRIGDEWKLTSHQNSDVNLLIKTVYKLKDINNDMAIIQSEGEISSDSSSTSLLGYNNVSSNLKGKQQALYEVETKTGMLISGKIKTKIKGELDVMGREIPVTIETSIKINGQRLN